MKPICRKLRDTLATDGPAAVRNDQAAQQHLAECERCFAFLESLSEIEAGLQNLPVHDAPDSVVEALLARPEIAQAGVDAAGPEVTASLWDRIRGVASSMLRPRTFVWASGMAAAVLLVVVVSVYQREGFGLAKRPIVLKDENVPAKTGDRLGNLREEAQIAPREIESTEQVGLTEEELRGLGYMGDEEGAASSKPDTITGGASVGDDRFAGREGEEKETEEARRQLEQGLYGFQKGKDNEFGQREPGGGEFRNDVGSSLRSESGDLDKIEASSETDAPAIADVQGKIHESDPTRMTSDDVDSRPNVNGGRTRDFKAQVGGVSGAGQEFLREASEPAPESGEQSEAYRFSRTVPEDESSVKKLRKKPRPKAAAPPARPVLAGTAGVTDPMLIEKSRVAPKYPESAHVARVEGQVVLQITVRKDGTVAEATVLKSTHEGLGFEEAAVEAVKQWRYEPAMQNGKPVDVHFTVTVSFELDGEQSSVGSPSERVLAAARNFLDERASLDGLRFQPASGYWANTYVPGDPTMRLLQARLARASLRLHDAARPAAQPFDAPDNAALGVYLHADRRGLTDEGRFLVQVGLQGTVRHGGRRPAMNLGLVLDLRGEITDETAIGVRALLDAFNRAKEPGDRFSLIVAGRPGAVAVEPRDFRHGYLKVTLDRLLADTEEGRTLGLVDAVATAIRRTSAADDPTTPLGSSAVILITGRELGDDVGTLGDLAHQGAVAGVPLSVIGVGENVNPTEMERLTLAGQGHRRLLGTAAEAEALVDHELSAVSRAIARAVRLRIRLAPGVELIDVLGSERLDEGRAQQVRDAERSIDLRLSRNLGIEADRGEDEEGIQVVIPSFYAGDSHVILLDVVAPGPGPVADVTLRYKDLVYLRNGVARDTLALANEERAAGSLERNVLKNLLSLRLAGTLDRAGRALASNDPIRAAGLLAKFETLLSGLRLAVPELDNDPDVMRDFAMLGEYRALLSDGLASNVEWRIQLSDSLRYAALLKVQPRPLET